MKATSNSRGFVERGQAVVEFALLIPILLVLVVGIAEFGRGWMTRNILVGAAREGARVAALQTSMPESIAKGQAAAAAVLAAAGITAPPASVTDPGGPFPAVRVTVTYNFPVVVLNFVPGLAGPSVALQGVATMRRERY